MSEARISGEIHKTIILQPLGTGAKCTCGFLPLSEDRMQVHLAQLPYNTIEEWRTTMKNNDYSVPLQACHILSKLIERDGISFREAYEKAIAEQGIILVRYTYFAHFGYLTKLIEDCR